MDLVKLRVSDHPAAHCLDMHWKDLRDRREQRLYSLDAWREPLHTERERLRPAWPRPLPSSRRGRLDAAYEGQAAPQRKISDSPLLPRSTPGIVSLISGRSSGDYKPAGTTRLSSRTRSGRWGNPPGAACR
jgi:hypothetical protein